ncbi:MAG: DUF1697 domain-containing protein [Chloroflexota bacterium]
MTYVVLLRGVNVGGKNIISMAALRSALEGLGFENVASYIASGNLIVDSPKSASAAQSVIEGLLVSDFGVSRESARALLKERSRAASASRPTSSTATSCS